MNFILTAVCLALCIYVVYQNYRLRTNSNKLIREVTRLTFEFEAFSGESRGYFREVIKLTNEFDTFVSENEVSFGNVEREIEAAKNEIILILKQDQLQPGQKKQSSQLKSLSQAFAAKTTTLKDDD